MELTETASKKLKEILLKEGVSLKEGGLRVKVLGGGCSGMSYEFNIAKAPQAQDQVFECYETRVIIDPASLLYVKGSMVDYSEALTGAGFKIINPNAKSTCFCGESFSV